MTQAPDATTRGLLDRRGRRGLVLGALTLLTLIGLLFWAAGRVDWIRGWAAVGAFVAGHLANRLTLLRRHPELLNRRGQRVPRGTKSWDRRLMAVALPMPFLIPVVAGLDAGRHGHELGWSWYVAGAVPFVLGVILGIAAMVHNAHFEKTVRLQEGHHVVDSGPYSRVRHPGYVASALVFGAAPLLLGSALALIPAGLFVALFVLRTAREDRTLRSELEGYQAYAQRVRWRLVPGLW
ncbi:MAG: isoprenylcysteine carboxylmethyltransferase family protein [Pseudomonadota bacterium]